MKKLLFMLLLAAATLPGRAEKYPNVLHVAGNATTAGWLKGTSTLLYQVSEKKYEGFVSFTGTEGGEVKFLCQSGWEDHWGPSSNGAAVSGNGTFNLSFCLEGKPDNKFKPTITGLYLVTVDVTTEGSETATFTQWTSSSTYEIGSLGQLKAFADGVNKFDASINAALTADITGMDYAIGWYNNADNNKLYSGNFNGNGHTVTLDINDENNSNKGLFGAAKGGAYIHDLIVAGSVTAQAKAAGIIGYADGGGTITLTNVINTATIQSTGSSDANAAGLVGCAVSSTVINATNCANTGNVSGQAGQCAAFAGWTQKSSVTKTTFTNCWNSGTINDIEGQAQLYRNSGEVTAYNCYDLTSTGDQGTRLDASTLGSGELCFKLNGDQTSINWYQTLGSDNHPVPFSSGHSQVYASGNVKCDGTLQGSNSFSNNASASSTPPHTFEGGNGWCTVCNSLNKTYLTADGEGYYSIGNANDLNWFAAYVEEVNHGANAKLTSDIATYSGAYIGNTDYTSFSGIFDGQNHKITVSFGNESKIGLFRCVKNGTIQNLIVDGTISAGNNNLMGGLVNESRESSVYRNIVVAVNMSSTHSGDGTHGGIISVAWGVPTLENVAFVGSINASNNYGSCGMIGYAHSGGSIHYKNCYVSGTLTLTGDNNRVFGRNGEYCDNCYTTLSMTKLNNADRFTGSDVTSSQVASGELCYLLNGSSCYGAKWFQNLTGTTDSYPVPFNTHGIVNKISSAGYTTQYIPSTDVTIPTGVKAYAGETSDTKLSLKELTDAISKEDAVILQGSEGFYSFVPTTGANKYTDNALQGSDGTVQGSGNNIYALSAKNEEVGFYPVGTSEKPVTIPAGKAYLQYTGGNAVKGFTFDFDDDATGISLMEDGRSQTEYGAIYNLAGQRINKMQRGINIVNGKKILK